MSLFSVVGKSMAQKSKIDQSCSWILMGISQAIDHDLLCSIWRRLVVSSKFNCTFWELMRFFFWRGIYFFEGKYAYQNGIGDIFWQPSRMRYCLTFGEHGCERFVLLPDWSPLSLCFSLSVRMLMQKLSCDSSPILAMESLFDSKITQ